MDDRFVSCCTVMLLVTYAVAKEKQCDVADMSNLFTVKRTEENLLPSDIWLVHHGKTVGVICVSSNVISSMACHDGTWEYYDSNCLRNPSYKKIRKRKKRFLGFIIRGIVCLFSRCSRPRPRDRTPPEIRNCPGNIFRDAISYQFFAFVSWAEPTAWDNKDGQISVTRNGKRPGAPFFEGITRVGYSAKDSSGNMKSCYFDIHITVIRCPLLSPRIPDGYRVCHLSYDMVKGTTCQYGCYQGHDLKGGPSYSECLPSGDWSTNSEPYCDKKKCDEILKRQRQTVTCSNQVYFRSICTFSCEEGYDIPDGIRRTKVCLATGNWNAVNPYCTDIESPSFEHCPQTLMFFPGDNEEKAIVYWEIPTVFDNEDTNITPRQQLGPKQGSSLAVGTYKVVYEAVDGAGNEATCSFQVVVKQLRCSRLYASPYLNLNCSGTRRGSSCSFHCDENSALNGTHTAYCLKVTDQPYSKWNMERQPFCQVTQRCPEITAPKNGAMACDVWLGGHLCHPSCSEGYSVLITNPLPEFVICTKDGTWLFRDRVTDCIAKEQSRRRLAEMTAEFYYTGNCNEQNVQVEIKKDFITTILTSGSWKSKCQSECAIENVRVVCGSLSRRKRSSTHLLIKMYIYFDSNTNETLTSDGYESEVQRLNDVMEIIQNDIYTVDAFPSIGNETILILSLTSSSLETECPANYVPDYGQTIGCVPCQPGTFYDINTKTCVTCQRGTYQPLASQNNCLPCSNTQTTARTGATSYNECEDACEPGTYSSTGLPPCFDCDIGYYESNYGSVECTECPGNKITLIERSTNVSECNDFDIVFPSFPNETYFVFDDPVHPLQVPFTISMHMKCDSSEGQLLALSSLILNLTITTSSFTVNSENKKLPDGLSPIHKWYYITLHLTNSSATLRMNENSAYVLPMTGLTPTISYEIKLGGEGFVGFISQFMITAENVYSEKSQHYRSCTSDKYDGGIVIWKDFAYSRLINSYIDFPSKCDDSDDCLSNPCIHGQCTDTLGAYSCSCSPGFSGVNCDVNIDDCHAHACQHNATCVDGIGNYSCACEEEYTGELCEIKMVDGNWSEWDNWIDCSVSCGNGTRQRHRSCSNPLPDNGGKYCDGNDTEIQSCILEPCRVCFDLVATNHSTLTCTNTSDMIVCTHTCDDGFWFDKDVREEYRCGNETFYYWDFQTDDNPYARLPQCTEIVEPFRIYVEYTASYDKEECDKTVQNLVHEIVSGKFRSLSCRQEGTCTEENYELKNCDEDRRTKRDLTDENVGFLVNLSCDTAKYGAESCYVKLADSMQEIETLKNEKELNFVHTTKSYQIISNSSTSHSSLECPIGTVPFILYCVPCSIGHYYNEGECRDCPVGTYQDDTGQTYCHSCPEGTTTSGTASLSVDDCVVRLDSESEEKLWYVIGIVLGIPTLLTCVIVSVLYWRQKSRQKNRRFMRAVPEKTDRVKKMQINLERFRPINEDMHRSVNQSTIFSVAPVDNMSFSLEEGNDS